MTKNILNKIKCILHHTVCGIRYSVYGIRRAVYGIRSTIYESDSFTLVEILIVVGILAIISTAGFVELAQFKSKHDFDLDAQSITEAISSVQSRAIQQDRGTAWGIRFINSTSTADTYQIFQGSSYSASSVVSSETLSSATIYTNPPPGFYIDVVFAARTGLPTSGSATSIVINRTGGTGLYTIMISASGRISKNLETGLVGYWPMDEGSGTNAYDASGNSHNGSLLNGPSSWQSICKAAGCFSFNSGSINIFNLGAIPSLTPSDITLSAWAKPSQIDSWDGIVSNMTSWGTGFSLQLGSAQKIAAMISGTYLSSITIPSAGIWYYIVATHNSSTNLNSLYVNGILEATSTQAVVYEANAKTYIGAFYTSPNLIFNGQIDDVRIYNRALSATEIQNLYNSY